MSDAPTVRARELVEQLSSESNSPASLAEATRVPSLGPSEAARNDPELAYLNRHWVWEAPATRGALGWLRTKLARLLDRDLDRYLLDERAFVERLVRFQNELAARCDQLAEETRSLASAQRDLLEAVEERLGRLERRTEALHGALEARLERLETAAVARPDVPPR